MNERQAREATWLEAFETAQPGPPSWTADDRAWADRVALEAAGPEVDADAFVSARAQHALHRLAPREAVVGRDLAAPAWRAGWTGTILAIAFIVGLLADSLGGGQRINLLAPPLWGVLAWNVAVYVLLVAWPLLRALRRQRDASRPPGPLLRAVAALLRVRQRLPRLSAGGSAAAVHRFATLWFERVRGLTTLRTEALLHAGAAALAGGLVAGLYARGLVFDYRAGWESTFLSPEAARALVGTVLWPASQLSGIALPDSAGFAALQSSAAATAGTPAGPWIHLLALTLGLVVVLPRGLLAIGTALWARRRSHRFVLPLDGPYFERLLRLQRGGAAHVVAFAYGTTLTPQATLGLRALIAGAFGPKVDLRIAPAVAFGDEDEAPPSPPVSTTHAVAVFDLSATPEAENQGRFLAQLGAALPAGAVLAVLLDETAFRRRFAAVAERLEQRRESWRQWGEGQGVAPIGVDLDGEATAAAEPLLLAAFSAPARPPAAARTAPPQSQGNDDATGRGETHRVEHR